MSGVPDSGGGRETGEGAAPSPSPAQYIGGLIARNPFGGWLGLRLRHADADRVDIELPWRAEFAGMSQGSFIHGGVLAALADASGSYAVTAHTLRPAPTVDLLVDYHQKGTPGSYLATARVLRLGGRLATAQIEIRDFADSLIATGRGKYVTQAGK